jgi:inner membrane protein
LAIDNGFMDNLAHSLVGLAAAKAGLERLSPGATSVCILAANAPDLDFISAISGDRWTVLHYHRGITHSLLGTLLLSLIIPTLFWLIERLISRAHGRPKAFRLRGLLLASLIAGATHPLLDWTNNYGVRPLLPWSGRWFYGDLVFIVDPILWLVFGGAAFLLTSKSKRQVVQWALLGAALTFLVVYTVVSGRGLEHPAVVLFGWLAAMICIVAGYEIDLGRRLGGKLAVTAFLILFIYWGALGILHSRALAIVARQAATLATEKREQVIQLAAMPTLTNPLHWRCLAETSQAVYRFDLYLTASHSEAMNLVRYAKPDQTEAAIIALAMKDRRTQEFFEFARFPVQRMVDRDCTTQTLVQFADLRYTEPERSRGNFSLELPVECPGQGARTDDGR